MAEPAPYGWYAVCSVDVLSRMQGLDAGYGLQSTPDQDSRSRGGKCCVDQGSWGLRLKSLWIATIGDIKSELGMLHCTVLCCTFIIPAQPDRVVSH